VVVLEVMVVFGYWKWDYISLSTKNASDNTSVSGPSTYSRTKVPVFQHPFPM